MANKGFTGTQKQYLEGLASGLRVARGTTRSILADLRARIAPVSGVGAAVPLSGAPAPHASTASAASSATGLLAQATHPDQPMWDAQDRQLRAGSRLAPEERAKRKQPPSELWARMAELARERRFPDGDDVFLYKFHGLFYVSPAEEAFMCRLRFAGGQIRAHQLRGVADLAERHARPYLQLTVRSNVQLRGIGAGSALDMLSGLLDLGIVTRGSGGDGVRNVGASPTAGFDERELIDTLPLAQRTHHRVLADRAMQAVPRKLTVAFDGGGTVSALAEACDVGFRAVLVPPGEGVEPGVYFRLLLGGATSHSRYGRDAGVLVAPDRCVEVLEQVLHMYVEHGDRSNRRRARLAYLLESWGLPRFVAELRARLRGLEPLAWATAANARGADTSGSDARRADTTAPLPELPLARCQLPRHPEPFAHVGFHAERTPGRCYVGVVVDGAQLGVAQARGLARIAEEYGVGELRFTPHQNVLIPGIASARRREVEAALAGLGLAWTASAFRSRLIACTGAPGCQFAHGDTKRRAEEIASRLEASGSRDQPLSIHISGCHHACAQHTTADIGLLATRDPGGGSELYQLWLGGELLDTARFGQKYASQVPASDVPRLLQEVVDDYLSRRNPDESFHDFVARLPPREPEQRAARLRGAGGPR
jgi:ferredoxin-nitrite reductase